MEAVERRVDQCSEQFANPVCPEVGKQDAVAVRHAAVTLGTARPDEFIGEPGLGVRLDRAFEVREGRALASHHQIVGEFDTVPAIVPVHREISPADRCNLRVGNGVDRLLQLGEFALRAFRRHIAPIQEGMYANGHALVRNQPGQGGDVSQMGMHTAR